MSDKTPSSNDYHVDFDGHILEQEFIIMIIRALKAMIVSYFNHKLQIIIPLLLVTITLVILHN